MVMMPGGTDRLSVALAQAIWVSSQSGRLPDPIALWVVRELVAADPIVAAAFTPVGRARLPQEEPKITPALLQEDGAAVTPALSQALTDVVYALDRAGQEAGGAAAVELVSARWTLLGRLARAYPAIAELLTAAAQVRFLVGIELVGIEVTRGMGRGHGVRLGEAQ